MSHDRLPDDELDALLTAAHNDTMRYIQERTQPAAGLLAFFEDLPAPEGAADALTAIKLRIRARTLTLGNTGDFCAEVLQARLPENITRCSGSLIAGTVLVRLIDLAEILDDRNRRLVRGIGRPHLPPGAHDRVPVGVRALTDAVDLARLLDPQGVFNSILNLISDLAHGIHDDRARDPHALLALARKLTVCLVLEVNNHFASCPDSLACVLPHFRERAVSLYDALDGARGSDAELNLSSFRANARGIYETLAAAMGKMLTSLPVDVPGMDLSGLRIPDVEVLADVVWSSATTWPADLHDAIQDHSEQIGPDRYRVRGGNEHDPHGTALR